MPRQGTSFGTEPLISRIMIYFESLRNVFQSKLLAPDKTYTAQNLSKSTLV